MGFRGFVGVRGLRGRWNRTLFCQEAVEDLRRSFLDGRQRFRERFLIASVECNVIGGCRVGFKTNSATHGERDRFRLRLSHHLRERRRVFLVVEHLVSEFVYQD